MIRRVYDALVPLTDEVWVSVRDSILKFDIPARHVADEISDAGPLAGLHAGLLATEREWVLTLACDLPYVTSSVLEELLHARKAGVMAVAATASAGYLEPLCACYHRRILPVVENHLSAGDYAMHRLLSRVEVRTVLLPDEALRNINRPRDL